jgi:3-hydroxybutyryl-CoA dehydrogenase
VKAREPIACLGAGRMGRGIAVVFAYAGHEVSLIDCKPRATAEFEGLAARAQEEMRATLRDLASFGLFDAAHLDAIAGRVCVVAGAARPPRSQDLR